MRMPRPPVSTKRELPPLPLASTQMRTERMYSVCGSLASPVGVQLKSAPMARTKKSIKSRSKVKKAALKRKRTRRNKGLKRGMRAR
jgi:hypothetical protein